jgi:hypothetical protein
VKLKWTSTTSNLSHPPLRSFTHHHSCLSIFTFVTCFVTVSALSTHSSCKGKDSPCSVDAHDCCSEYCDVGVFHTGLRVSFQIPFTSLERCSAKDLLYRKASSARRIATATWASLLCESSHLNFNRKGLHLPTKNNTCTRTTPCHTSNCQCESDKDCDSGLKCKVLKGLNTINTYAYIHLVLD